MTVYCTAPWNGITVRENGDVKTCCSGGTVLGNLNQESIQQILQSSKLQKIQSTMTNGCADSENCAACLRQEKNSGLAALRQHYLSTYPSINNYNLQLKNLDLRWSNLCNLTCIYCSPVYSSAWQNKLSIKVDRSTKHYQDELLQFVLENTDQINEIMLVGGEPMLMKQNHRLFDALPPSTKISIITNVSYDLSKLSCVDALLRRPQQNINWILSFENIGDQFEYVRNGARWEQVQNNLQFLNCHWPNNYAVNMVYSMLNAFDIDKVVPALHQLGLKKFTFQSYFGKPAFNVFAMPDAIKQQAYQCLQQAIHNHFAAIDPEDHSLYPIQHANALLASLENTKSSMRLVTKQEFYEHVDWCDQWNQNAYRDLWPHVVKLIDQHLV